MTEDNIIKGCQKGRADSQRALVHQYAGLLMTVARRYSRDDHSAQDVLQEAFIRIFQALPQYEHRGTFTAWMRRIVVNIALQQKERMSYHNEQYTLDDQPHPLVSDQALQALEAEDLIRLVQQLPDGLREVFNLYVMEGYNHDEIAALLALAPGTSRSRLTRARQLLQTMVLAQEKERYVKRVG